MFMTPVDFSAWRNRYGLTQEGAAEQFRLAVEIIQNWENGVTAIPSAVDDFCVIWGRRLRQLDPLYGPLTLVYFDKPGFSDSFSSRPRPSTLKRETCVCNASAIARAAMLSHAQRLFEPHILEHESGEPDEILWSTGEVDDFLSGKDTSAPTVVNLLRTIATGICETTALTAWEQGLPAEQRATRKAKLEAEAKKLNQIAERGINGDTSADEIELILTELRNLGASPRNSDVTGIFRALAAQRQTVPVRHGIGLPTVFGMARWRLRHRA
jgi:hypothetical protein